MKRVVKELNELLEFDYFVEEYFRDPITNEEVTADMFGPFLTEDEAYDELTYLLDNCNLFEFSY